MSSHPRPQSEHPNTNTEMVSVLHTETREMIRRNSEWKNGYFILIIILDEVDEVNNTWSYSIRYTPGIGLRTT